MRKLEAVCLYNHSVGFLILVWIKNSFLLYFGASPGVSYSRSYRGSIYLFL